LNYSFKILFYVWIVGHVEYTLPHHLAPRLSEKNGDSFNEGCKKNYIDSNSFMIKPNLFADAIRKKIQKENTIENIYITFE